MKPRPRLENETEQQVLLKWLEDERDLAANDGISTEMYERLIKYIDDPWIKPSDDPPNPGDLIAVKWKNSNHYDYDCWEYWPDKGQGCNWDDALCWMKLPRPVVAGEKS